MPKNKETHKKISPNEVRKPRLIRSIPILLISTTKRKVNLLSRKVMSPRASKMFLAQCWAFNTKLKVVPGQKKTKTKETKI